MGSLSDALKKAEQEQAEGTDGLEAPSGDREAVEALVSGHVPAEASPSAPDARGPGDSTAPTAPPRPSAAASESESAAAAAASEQLVDMIGELEARLAALPPRDAASPPPDPPPPGPAAPPLTPRPAPDAPLDPVPDAESLILVPTYQGPSANAPVADAPPSVETRTAPEPAATPPPREPSPPRQPSAPPPYVDEGRSVDDSTCIWDEELAEPYRVIRRRLIERLPRERNLVVAVVGSEPSGESGSRESWSVKSAAALNLGSVLAEIKGTTALVVEADSSSRSISQLLGVSDDVPGLANVLRGEAAVEQVMHRNLVGHLDVITAGAVRPERTRDPLATPIGVELMAQLRDRYDFVLVDAASSPSAGAIEVYHDLYSGVLVVTTTDPVDQRHAKVLLDRLETHDVRVFGCILAAPDEGSSEEAA